MERELFKAFDFVAKHLNVCKLLVSVLKLVGLGRGDCRKRKKHNQ